MWGKAASAGNNPCRRSRSGCPKASSARECVARPRGGAAPFLVAPRKDVNRNCRAASANVMRHEILQIAYLALACIAAKLDCRLDRLLDAGCPDGMAACLKPAARVD